MTGATIADSSPTLRVLSLGAGVQSTAVMILSAMGHLPRIDYAIFSDTGWEPGSVYAHLDRLEREVAQPAGIPILRVSAGNIRDDALDPTHRFVSMPLYVKNQDDGDGIGRRQCTSEYKLKPIRRKVRELLGAKPKDTGVPGPVARGRWVEQWIGISTDERDRALDQYGSLKTGDVSYSRNVYPLLALDYSREACRVINEHAGFVGVPKSACIGCPYHGNRQWRDLRDNQPAEWADAVDFDHAIRNGSARANAQGQPLRGQMFLHRSRVPLEQAPIDRVTRGEWKAMQGDLIVDLQMAELRERLDADTDSQLEGCSPHACRSGGAVAEVDDEEFPDWADEEAS